MGEPADRRRAYARDLRRLAVLFGPLHLVLAALTWDAVDGPGLVALRLAGGVSTLGAVVSVLWWASISLGSDSPRRGAALGAAALGVAGAVLTVLVTVVSVAGSEPIPGELPTAVVFALVGATAWWVARGEG